MAMLPREHEWVVAYGRVDIDLTTLPMDVTLSFPRLPFLIVLVAVLCLLPATARLLPVDASLSEKAFLALFPAFILWMAAACAYALLRHRHISFGQDGVRVTEVRWGRPHEWRAPYTEFKGVVLRSWRNDEREHWPILELRHAEPRKTIPLYVGAWNSPAPTAALLRYAKRLGVPALIESLDGSLHAAGA
jgi:hypothetical protein